MRRSVKRPMRVFAFVVATLLPVAAQALECGSLRLAQDKVAPFGALPLAQPLAAGAETVTIDFGPDSAGESWTASLPVTDAAALRVPVYLHAPMAGGMVQVQIAGGGISCDLGALRVAGLPAAPGTIAALIAQSRARARAFENAFGLDRSAKGVLEGQVNILPPVIQSLVLFQQDLEQVLESLQDDPLSNAVAAQISRAQILPPCAAMSR